MLVCACAWLLLASDSQASESTARGEHLATVMGCTSCHGQDLRGHLHEEDPDLMTVWNSNLSLILPGWSDDQIEATLRTGRRPDGSALWGMPTFVHRQLSPQDMNSLIAWLRTVPAGGQQHPPMQRGPQFEQALTHGMQDSAAQAERLAARHPADAGESTRTGRYLATLACGDCHGPSLQGVREPRPGQPPDLAAAAAYSPPEFARLLATGVARDGRPLAEMSTEGPKRLGALTPNEVQAIYEYLKARAAQ